MSAGAGDDDLVVDLGGYEGPIDVLLTLARDQKVDLARISILALADQYLAFVATARRLRLELAADYLVMAAWLAYLKSRLLLPPPAEDEEPSGPEMAAALAFQLQRLEAMQTAGAQLADRPRLGRDVFARGMTEDFGVTRRPLWQARLHELLRAYGRQAARRAAPESLRILPSNLMTMDQALQRLGRMIGQAPDWTSLARFLPEEGDEPLVRRAALAAMVAASLEMARDGRLHLRQDTPFGPIYVRRRSPS